MSRIGKIPIIIPDNVYVFILDNNKVVVKGPLGELSQDIIGNFQLKIENKKFFIKRKSEKKKEKSLHGLYRMLIHNMIIGVSIGFKKELEIIGVGYRVSNKDRRIEFHLGYSHNIIIEYPNEIKINLILEKGKNLRIVLFSCDKQLLGIFAAKIRSLKKPEPYKGKGIRYLNEKIIRKVGKSA